MVLNFVYHWIIHLRWFYYFMWLARIKILNQVQFVERRCHNTFGRFYPHLYTVWSFFFYAKPQAWHIIAAQSAVHIISPFGAVYHHAPACIFPAA